MKIKGYKRSDGRIGIRNKVVVMPGVLCAESIARKVAESVPGVTFVHNPNGCAQSPSDIDITLRTMTGMLANGNVYGALIVGLGCETITRDRYMDAMAALTDKPVYYMSIQEIGDVDECVEYGKKILMELTAGAGKCDREDVDISELILGLECGGSDATSGISSNVVLGKVSDRLLDMGGTAVLSETTEAIGAEHILRERGRTPEIGQKLYDTIVSWERDRAAASNCDIREGNPSPGNKDGGITTLVEKSLGCIHKSGSKPFEAVVDCSEQIDCKGLVFMNATAYDVTNVTSLAAGGAQIVVFTTGRGNPAGNPVASVVKVTGNSSTYKKMKSFIDMDTSATITGEKTVDEVADEMFDLVIRVCEGEETKAEKNGAVEVSINQFDSFF